MDILETSADLINEILEMGVRQRLTRPDDLMQISFHQLLNEVPLNKTFRPWHRETEKVYLQLIEILQVDNIHVNNRGDLFPTQRHTRQTTISTWSLRSSYSRFRVRWSAWEAWPREELVWRECSFQISCRPVRERKVCETSKSITLTATREYLFDGNLFTGFCVLGSTTRPCQIPRGQKKSQSEIVLHLPHDAIGTLAHFADELILAINNKVLIDDRERLVGGHWMNKELLSEKRRASERKSSL